MVLSSLTTDEKSASQANYGQPVHNIMRSRARHRYGIIEDSVIMPNLIQVQRESYDLFLQLGVYSSDRGELGIQAAFKSIFPICDFNDRAQLEFDGYILEKPKI